VVGSLALRLEPDLRLRLRRCRVARRVSHQGSAYRFATISGARDPHGQLASRLCPIGRRRYLLWSRTRSPTQRDESLSAKPCKHRAGRKPFHDSTPPRPARSFRVCEGRNVLCRHGGDVDPLGLAHMIMIRNWLAGACVATNTSNIRDRGPRPLVSPRMASSGCSTDAWRWRGVGTLGVSRCRVASDCPRRRAVSAVIDAVHTRRGLATSMVRSAYDIDAHAVLPCPLRRRSDEGGRSSSANARSRSRRLLPRRDVTASTEEGRDPNPRPRVGVHRAGPAPPGRTRSRASASA